MRAPINDDNLYQAGTTIYARTNPDVKLVIMDYKSRIYYCKPADVDGAKTVVYFERELLPPSGALLM